MVCLECDSRKQIGGEARHKGIEAKYRVYSHEEQLGLNFAGSYRKAEYNTPQRALPIRQGTGLFITNSHLPLVEDYFQRD